MDLPECQIYIVLRISVLTESKRKHIQFSRSQICCETVRFQRGVDFIQFFFFQLILVNTLAILKLGYKVFLECVLIEKKIQVTINTNYIRCNGGKMYFVFRGDLIHAINANTNKFLRVNNCILYTILNLF